MTPSLPDVSSGGPETLPRPRGTASVGIGRRRGRSGLPEEATPRERLAGLSVVLPCFNEVDALATAVREAQRAARAVSVRHEVIVVDDGSTDGSADLVARLTERRRGVRLLVHVTNRGPGAAVRSGVEAATMPYVLIADFELELDELTSFVHELEWADAVVGYRQAHRRSVWCALLRRLYGPAARDAGCSLKLFPRELLLALELEANGIAFGTELVLKALAAGATLAEVAVSDRTRAPGKRGVPELVRLHPSLRRLAHGGPRKPH